MYKELDLFNGAGLAMGRLPCPTVYQIENCINVYSSNSSSRCSIDNMDLIVHDLSVPFYTSKGRRIAAFVDKTGRINIPVLLLNRIMEYNCWSAFRDYFNIILSGIRGDDILLSNDELQEVISHMEKLNIQSPGQGISEIQAKHIRKMYTDGYILKNDTFEYDIDFGLKKVFGNMVQTAARIITHKNRAEEWLRLENLLDDIDKMYVKNKPVRVFFVSFGSIWHQDVWNILAIETLAGDLVGEFGDQVVIGADRIYSAYEINDLLNSIKEFRPDILGISIEIKRTDLYKEFITKYRSFDLGFKPPLVVFGNTVPTYFPQVITDDPLNRREDTIIIRGEGELALRNLVKVVKGEALLEDTHNAIWWDDRIGDFRWNDVKEVDSNILIHPPLPLTVKPNRVNILQASRGCIFKCSFCSQGPNKTWRPLPLERVCENIEILISKGVNEFEFVDDEFFGGRTSTYLERAQKIALIFSQLSKKYDVKISYRIFSNPMIIARHGFKFRDQNKQVFDTLKLMKESGLERIYIGIESGADSQRARYNRKEKKEDCVLALETLRKLDIEIHTGFIMFDPELELHEMEENIKFFRDNKLIDTNTWPFRPLELIQDTPLVQRYKNLGLIIEPFDIKEFNYRYIYKNPEVGYIAEKIQHLAQKTAKLFTTLKYITKEHHGRMYQNEASRFAFKCVTENAEIYLDLMSQMIMAIRESCDIQDCIKKACLRLEELIKEIEDNLHIFKEHGYSIGYIEENLVLAKKNLYEFVQFNS